MSFMTERKKKVLETFERVLPMTSDREDKLLEAFMEGILMFKEKGADPDPDTKTA